LLSVVQVWPHGLCYVNELWGGTRAGYIYVSEANYDWGQGLRELARWQEEKKIARIGICYFGTDPHLRQMSVELVPLHEIPLTKTEDVPAVVHEKYLAVSVSILHHIVDTPAMRQSLLYLHRCRPVARTMTFLIYDFSHSPEGEVRVEESEHGSWPVRRN